MKSRLIGFLQQHGNSSIGKDHRDSATHGSSADHCNRIHWEKSNLFWYVGDLGYFTLAEERMNKGLGLIREKALAEQFLFHLASFFKREPGGGFHRIDGGKRRHHATLFGVSLFACGSKDGCVLLG